MTRRSRWRSRKSARNTGSTIRRARASKPCSRAPRPLGGGLWQSVLTFPDLPLHSGEYVVSAYVFDASGLLVYEQWYQFLHFRFVAPTLMPGLVHLPHHWS